jgi:hypothetical protein
MKAITVVGLRHEKRHREIEHEKKLDEAQSKKDKGKGKDSSKPESSNHKGGRKTGHDKQQKTTGFSNSSKSKDKDVPKRTHHNTEEALKGMRASLHKKRRERNSASDAENPTNGKESVMARLWPCLAAKWMPFSRRYGMHIPRMTRVLWSPLHLRRQK